MYNGNRNSIQKIFLRLTHLELWIVGGLAAASMAFTQLLLFTIVVGLIFWVVRRITFGRWSAVTPLDIALLPLVVMLPVTLWITPQPGVTQTQVYRLAVGILLYYSIVNGSNCLSRLRLLLLGLLLAGTAFVFISPVSVAWETNSIPWLPPAIYQPFRPLLPDTINPNVLAGSIVIIFPLGLAMWLFDPPRQAALKIATGAALVLAILVLALSQSRGAWLALLAVLLLLVAMRWRRGWVVTAAISGIFVGGVIINSAITGDTQRARLYSTALSMVVSVGGGTGLNQRLEIWGRTLDMIGDFPFTGVGMGNFSLANGKIYPTFYYPPGEVRHAHNLFLQIAVDVGLPGLAAWLAMLVIITYAAWQVYRRGQSRQDRWLAGLGAGLLCAQAALAIHGMLDAVTWGMVKPAPLVWALWGLTVGALQLSSSAAKKAAAPPIFGDLVIKFSRRY